MPDESALPLVLYPDPVLRQQSAEVTEFDGNLHLLISRLKTTLSRGTGIGLSAPQIGVSQRVVVLDTTASDGNETSTTHGANTAQQSCPHVYVNPVITQRAGFAFVREACLSLPGISASVIRAAELCVDAQDEHGQHFSVELSGMPAVCLQHELDHLNGILFIDHVSRLRSWRFSRTLKSLENNACSSSGTEPGMSAHSAW